MTMAMTMTMACHSKETTDYPDQTDRIILILRQSCGICGHKKLHKSKYVLMYLCRIPVLLSETLIVSKGRRFLLRRDIEILTTKESGSANKDSHFIVVTLERIMHISQQPTVDCYPKRMWMVRKQQ